MGYIAGAIGAGGFLLGLLCAVFFVIGWQARGGCDEDKGFRIRNPFQRRRLLEPISRSDTQLADMEEREEEEGWIPQEDNGQGGHW